MLSKNLRHDESVYWLVCKIYDYRGCELDLHSTKLNRLCEERSDEAIQSSAAQTWIAALRSQ